jgi:hypothetical protein
MNFAQRLLSAVLPLKGSKTILGGYLVALGGLQEILPGVDLMEALKFLFAHPTKTGLILAAIGIADKKLEAVKKRYESRLN